MTSGLRSTERRIPTGREGGAGRRALPSPCLNSLSADSRRTVLSTVEVSPKSEPRGGRWEEAESPQLLQTHSLFGNRKRKEPLASPDGSGKKRFSFLFFLKLR